MFEEGKFQPAAFSYYPCLGKVQRFVDQHHAELLSLKVAARVAGLEEKYFSAFFRAKTGVCFSDWLAAVRVRRAMERIAAQNDSITQIAFAVGFQDLRTFERVFKRHVGMTPRSYKRRVRPS